MTRRCLRTVSETACIAGTSAERWRHSIVVATANRHPYAGNTRHWSNPMTPFERQLGTLSSSQRLGAGVCTPLRGVLDGLTTVLDGRFIGDKVPFSEVRARPHRHVSRPRLAEVLVELGFLEDDSTPAIRAWIDRATTELSHGFGEPARQWLLVLLDGDARARPRSQATLYAYFESVRPLLTQWGHVYVHLREVTKSDVYQAIRPMTGSRRNNTVTALRSLFRFAKNRGLIFTNPTTGVKAPPSRTRADTR